MTDVDGRTVSRSVACPDCGTICSSNGEYGGGITKHRGSHGCKLAAVRYQAEKRGLAHVYNVWGIVKDSGTPHEWIKLPPKTGDTIQREKHQLYVPVRSAKVLDATRGWKPLTRAEALRIATNAGAELGAVLDFMLQIGDLAGARTVLEANLSPERRQVEIDRARRKVS